MSVTIQRTDRPCRLVSWTPWPFPNSSLVGHCAVAFAGGWIVHQIPVFRRTDGNLSVGVPNAAQLGAEGRIKQRDGKRDYKPILTFETAEGRERWQRLVTGALATGGITGAPEGAL
jgi:hypothetical protein